MKLSKHDLTSICEDYAQGARMYYMIHEQYVVWLG